MNNIKKARIASGLSQKEVALTLKVAQPSVSAWEAGTSIPAGKNLIALSDLLGVSTDQLLGNDELEGALVQQKKPSIDAGGDERLKRIIRKLENADEKTREATLDYLDRVLPE